MVMPLARSSGAASISSNFFASARPACESIVVIADVSDVLPWSTWPIVPTFTCGFVLSNRCLAIFYASLKAHVLPEGANFAMLPQNRNVEKPRA